VLFLTGTILLGANVSDHTFSLIKTNEICLYRPAINMQPWSKVYTWQPLFAKAPSGEILFFEYAPGGKSLGYFFSSQGNLERIAKVAPMGSKGKPGVVSSGIRVVSTTPDNEFWTYDLSSRINFFNSKGEFLKSILHPCFNSTCSFLSASFDGKTFAFAGFDIKVNDQKQEWGTQFIIVNYLNPAKTKTYHFANDAYTIGNSKCPIGYSFINTNVNFLSSGKIACNVSSTPDIFLVSNDGSYISTTTAPPHFKSIKNADVLKADWSQAEDSTFHLKKNIEDWLCTWTNSYPVYEYTENRLIVPRVLYPTFYLDLYSYTDKSIDYLGYVYTNKPFLFADSSGVYLLESKDDTSVVIGRYDLVTPDYYETRDAEWKAYLASASEAIGIRKVAPASDSGKVKTEIQPLSSIEGVKLVSANGGEYLLTDSLTRGKGHVLCFGDPNYCSVTQMVDTAKSYVAKNPDFDYALIYTHPYAEEIKDYVRLKRSYTDYPILTNIDKKKLEQLLTQKLEMLIVSKDGAIIERR
jgi:hypothetical protein